MIFPIANLIQTLSSWWTLRPGDIIFTGTPAGVASLESGDKVEVESPSIGLFFWSLA
jgi:2-keto-4-pentenoate hydratase/2-oxohepta-3-ene-1,7-dioic acid hydratase in catechol pathway